MTTNTTTGAETKRRGISMADRLDFDGPPNWHVFGHRYVTLTDGGIKEECRPYPGSGFDTAEEALASLAREIDIYAHGAAQLAWRRRPETIEYDGKWRANCRLAVFGHSED